MTGSPEPVALLHSFQQIAIHQVEAEFDQVSPRC